MMETTDFRDRDDWPGGYPSDPVIWCVLLEAKVRSPRMIVPSVGREDVSKVRFVDDDDVIETLSSDRAWLHRDRDRIYGDVFQRRLAGMGIVDVVAAPASPWQNPYVERLI